MPYRIRYDWNIDWVAGGQGPSGSPFLGQGSGNAQTIGGINTAGYVNTTVPGGGSGGAINSTDVTTLTNAMAADVAAQMTAVLGRMQGFVTGGS